MQEHQPEQMPPEIAAEMMPPPPLVKRRGRSLGNILRFIFVFACIGLGIVFTLQNTDVVTVAFLVWSITLSRALLVFLLVVVGTLLGWVLRSMVDDEGFRPLG